MFARSLGDDPMRLIYCPSRSMSKISASESKIEGRGNVVKRLKVVSIAVFLMLLVFGRPTTYAQFTANPKGPGQRAATEPKPPLPVTKHMSPPGPYTDEDFLVGDLVQNYNGIRRTGLTIFGRGVATSITPIQVGSAWSAVVGIAGKRQHQSLFCTFNSRVTSPNDVPRDILNRAKVGDTVVVSGESLDENAPLDAPEKQEEAATKVIIGSTPHFECRLTNLSDPARHVDRYGSPRFEWDPRCQSGYPPTFSRVGPWQPGSLLDKYCSVRERN